MLEEYQRGLVCNLSLTSWRKVAGNLEHLYMSRWSVVTGARKHGQEGALAPLLWKCCKVFCALVVTTKRSVDELLKRHFHNLPSASGSFVPWRPPPELHPVGRFRPQTPNLPISGKKILRAPMSVMSATSSQQVRNFPIRKCYW